MMITLEDLMVAAFALGMLFAVVKFIKWAITTYYEDKFGCEIEGLKRDLRDRKGEVERLDTWGSTEKRAFEALLKQKENELKLKIGDALDQARNANRENEELKASILVEQERGKLIAKRYASLQEQYDGGANESE